MIYRERSRRAAVATATAATRDELQPLGNRVRALGTENPRPSPLPDRPTDLAASRFPGASTLAMLLRMLCAPAPHREPRLVEVSPHPVAAIGATPIAILVGHAEHLAGRRARGNRTEKNEKKETLRREHCCGGKIRTSGLWVMSPTSYRCSTPHDHLTPSVALQRLPKNNAIHRCTREGPPLATAADGPLACPSLCTCTSASFGPTIP